MGRKLKRYAKDLLQCRFALLRDSLHLSIRDKKRPTLVRQKCAAVGRASIHRDTGVF